MNEGHNRKQTINVLIFVQKKSYQAWSAKMYMDVFFVVVVNTTKIYLEFYVILVLGYVIDYFSKLQMVL